MTESRIGVPRKFSTTNSNAEIGEAFRWPALGLCPPRIGFSEEGIASLEHLFRRSSIRLARISQLGRGHLKQRIEGGVGVRFIYQSRMMRDLAQEGLMSRVRAYLSEGLVSVVRKSPLVFPIPAYPSSLPCRPDVIE